MQKMYGVPKVHIGARYHRPWFEERTSDGTYRGFNAPMSLHAMQLQKAFLTKPKLRTRSMSLFGTGVVTLSSAFFAAAIVAMKVL